MTRKFTAILSIFFLFISSYIFAFSLAKNTHAAPSAADFLKFKTIIDYEKEFCDKRSGDLMNLETWYSGKCSPTTDTLSGDGVGFGDIIFLHGVESIIGAQYTSFTDLVINFLKNISTIGNIVDNSNQLKFSKSIGMSDGLLPQLGFLLAKTITIKPASTIDYVNYVANNLKQNKVISNAYAATPGYGFTALSPILPIWKSFRDISYILFSLAFVIYGFMIMFRIKIDSKTAASVQLALPKLIMTLLMITFSYAIVGFLVDLSTVAGGLLINILRLGSKPILNPDLTKFGVNMIGAVSGQTSTGAILSFLINSIVGVIISPIIVFTMIFFGSLGSIIGLIAGIAIASPLVGWAGMVIALIVMLTIGYAYFKLVTKLFSAFISVIVSLIFAPILLLGNVLPGSNAFSAWIMGLIANLSVFPIASFFLVLAYALMLQPIFGMVSLLPSAFSGIAIPKIEESLGVMSMSALGPMWSPPMTVGFGNANIPGIGDMSGSVVLGLIGFGILLMASKYVDMVRDALKVPPFKYGSAIGEALKSGYQNAPLTPFVGTRVSKYEPYKAVGEAVGVSPKKPAPWSGT